MFHCFLVYLTDLYQLVIFCSTVSEYEEYREQVAGSGLSLLHGPIFYFTWGN
jgi:hypothetical protein